MRSVIAILLGLAVASSSIHAAGFAVQQPSMDKWMYPFSTTGGSNAAIQTFGVVGDPRFDNRDGQMFLRFNTTGIAAAGLGASSYQLSTITLTLTLSSTDTLYDPTYDAYSTYLSGGTDLDAGRPVEVFGVGYRNGVTSQTWTENASFTNPPNPAPLEKSLRSAYAAGFNGSGQLIDVSNNVDQGFDVSPWAIGNVAGATPGSALAIDTEMTFTFNLSDPNILAYFQAALNQGYLDLMVTSLYGATQPGEGEQTNFPVFYSKESEYQDEFVAGRLSGDLTVVPEPGTLGLFAVAAAMMLGFHILRRRRA